jgi:glycine amidinotransferase
VATPTPPLRSNGIGAAQLAHTHSPAPESAVNSFNDFDPLQEIIVGWPWHLSIACDVSFRLFSPFAARPSGAQTGIGSVSGFTSLPRLRDELREDTEKLVAVLRSGGITVRQPDFWEEAVDVVTPDWESDTGHNSMPRDIALVLGNEIVETPPLVRSRYFEGHLYKALFMEYFNNGARWTVAPRPRMRDENFDYSYALANGWSGAVPKNTAHEIMFDAPQIMRLGQDLLFNWSTQNHVLGAQWLARHVEERFTVHPMRTGVDTHIDCCLIALRPGLLLVHAMFRDVNRFLPKFMHRWDKITYDPVDQHRETFGQMQMSSPAITMNVLSLDRNTVLVEESAPDLIAVLQAAGLEVVTSSWRHGHIIGGGFHCMTLDIRRDGVKESYAS